MTTTAPTYYFDLSGFLHRLDNEGFSIGVDTHILIQKIIGDLPLGYEPQVLETLLMPILCKSPKQQVIYQAVFRQFLRKDIETIEATDNPPKEEENKPIADKKNIFQIGNILFGIILLLLVLLFFWGIIKNPYALRPSGIENPIGFILLMFIVGIVAVFFIWKLIQYIKNNLKKDQKQVAKNEHGITPDDVHKIYADLVPVTFSDTLTQAIARLRLREPLGVQRLDVANTVTASIQNLGFFTPKYQDYTKYTEYLILIQADNSDDHKAKLYNTFYEELLYRNIAAVRYYFRTSPRYCYNEQETEATLDTVLHDNAHCVLLVFADLNTFISLKSNTAFAWTKPLTDLPQRYLMLPFGSAMEAVMARPLEGIFNAVLPATELGFEQLQNYLNQGDLKDDFTRFIRLRQAVPTFPIRIESEAELLQLEELLPNDSRKYLLKWIVACAVYPDFSWKMTLFLGQLLVDDEVTYNTWDNLRQLARISWFKEAYMPQSVRRIILEKTDKQTLTWLSLEDIAYIKKGIQQVYLTNKQQGFTGENERLLSELYKEPKTEAEKQAIKSKLANSVDYVTATLVDSSLKDILFFELPDTAFETNKTGGITTSTPEPPTAKDEKTAFDKAMAVNTAAVLKAFLQEFPNGEFYNMASQRLAELQMEEVAKNIENKILKIESSLADRAYLNANKTLILWKEEINEQLKQLKNLPQNHERTATLSQRCNQLLEKIDLLSLLPETVFIKGGTFLMGSPENEVGRNTERETQHEVKLSDFYMAKYTVTLGEFEQFIQAANYQTDADRLGSSYIWTGSEYKDTKGVNWKCDVNGKPQTDKQHPVIHVSWNDAKAYAKWLSEKHQVPFDLPTEAQWEYACRAGTSTPFNTGENLTTEQANYDGNYPYNGNAKGKYLQKTTKVGSYPPNSLGLYDMHGNVWEWCEDWYGEKYYEECKQQGMVENPAGPESGSYRVLRGGSWNNFAQYCRSAYRISNTPGRRDNDIGFRLVCSPVS
jgi:formylglycine-generating enzyme required for sulfatase activity